MQIKSKKILIAMITINIISSSSFTADNFHDREMGLAKQNSNNTKDIINQHKSRIVQNKKDADYQHRKISEEAAKKRKLARKITNTAQRNASLKLINQETNKLHTDINNRQKTLNSNSVKLKTNQLKASREKYNKQLETLRAERKKTLDHHKKFKINSKSKAGTTKPVVNYQTPRRAFSKEPLPNKA